MWARVVKRNSCSFTIWGSPKAEISFEVKAKQRGYEKDNYEVWKDNEPKIGNAQNTEVDKNIDIDELKDVTDNDNLFDNTKEDDDNNLFNDNDSLFD
ncbi:MAG: hypothetical protein IJH34_02555 [Romboutsia sp.]|nr:hypothetical protein [Romboutsia sp.]